AKIAAKLAIGYSLDELKNDITRDTPASFEPAIDYVVTKIPKFNFEKFQGASKVLGTMMRSVGEVMAIGRTFRESFFKAVRSLEQSRLAIPSKADANKRPEAELIELLKVPTPDRPWALFEALQRGWTVERLFELTNIDPWFLRHLSALVIEFNELSAKGSLANVTTEELKLAKSHGFSDAQLAMAFGVKEPVVREERWKRNLRPVYKRVDTCAAEFEAYTPYLYSTYEEEDEAPPTKREKVVILGSGPIRIGQGIEFDYACVHAAFALREAGYETIMVNCNPETVSTDYDTADRLYFEPLTAEDVIELVDVERRNGELLGLIVQFGGQTPLKLAKPLEAAGIPILGTSPDAIDLAEDRERFQQLIHKLKLRQPDNGTATSQEQAIAVAERIGYPVVIRPSYVLGGRAMQIVYDREGLERYTRDAVKVSGANPVLIDSYLRDAIEVDVDALADKDHEVFVAGIMEHIEEAGIHSGDSACSLPPYSLPAKLIGEIERQTEAMARALGVVGLMNVQYAVKDGDVYVLEVNPRASRTVPFVAKATGQPIAKFAARLMAGEALKSLGIKKSKGKHIAVKEAVFPFARFPGVDVILGPEMRSTGEVMGLDRDFGRAFAKSQLGAGSKVPVSGVVFVSVKDTDKPHMVAPIKRLVSLGFTVVATGGTADFLAKKGIAAQRVNKVLEGRPHIVDLMKDGKVQLVFNTVDGSAALTDSFTLRRTALMHKIAYYTTVAGAKACVEGIAALSEGALDVAPLQSYFKTAF
ncbi:MAG: carbamoyl-phosphate synthase large subunit, partial [Proteobacteria bacterium]|nr:carbamoyl-phosphate synthase large subunit [Pseudomonadota bacterium]